MALSIAAFVYLVGFYGLEESDEERQARRERAIESAHEVTQRSVLAARAPLSVVAASGRGEEGGASLSASNAAFERWSPGQAARLEGVIAQRESVSAALRERGLSHHAIHLAVSSVGELFDFRHSKPGHSWSVEVDAEGQITRFRYKTSPEDIWQAERTSKGAYSSHKVKVEIEVEQEAVGGQVSSSLWSAMEQAGVSAPLVGSFIELFSQQVDFEQTTRPGDTFALVYETIHLEGELLRTGRILAARYDTPDKVYEIYFYQTEKDEEQGYYNALGESVQRMFLKNPLSNIRITSTFGKRFHPVLKRWKMHSGVDYGAPTGTPVMSVAKGVVSFSGYKGANGNLVTVKHAGGYTTHYAHLSSIPSSIKPGAQVTRQSVIGRVGSTGRSTGPHLHFGVSKRGTFIDPLKADLMRAKPLRHSELERFTSKVLEPLNEALDGAGRRRADPAHAPQHATHAKVYEDNGEELY